MSYKSKRTLDILLSSLGLFFLSPLFLLLSLLIYLDDSGPVFYKQTRIGYKGKPFLMWKFRSMILNAEHLIVDYEGINQCKNNVLFKIKDGDPRVTRIGKLLRDTSLDELPQLFNVLKGDLSLCGPRPLSLRDWNLLDSKYHDRCNNCLPGITGLWQTYGSKRWDLSFHQVYKLDKFYSDNCSLSLDFQIFIKTLLVVFSRNGTC